MGLSIYIVTRLFIDVVDVNIACSSYACCYFILMDGIHVTLSELHVSPGHKWKKTCVTTLYVLLVIVGVFGVVIGVSWCLGKS